MIFLFLFVQCFQKMFGEEFLQSVDAESHLPHSVERPETSESTSVVLEARGHLYVKEVKLLC